MNSRTFHHSVAIRLFAVLIIQFTLSAASAQAQKDDEAMAAYADAANFQTGGAIDLAIQAWDSFLSDYPKHKLASHALHYLGVCHMQSEEPDYQAASKAFARALRNKKYDLREESLANHGWCLYASAGDGADGQPRNPKQLKQAIATFKTLRKEFPESRFIDRAIFYSGEAAFGLNQTKQAIDYYDQLLAMPKVKDSPLRCDALYARGVAYEQLEKYEDAFATYQQLIDQCKESSLVIDAYVRMGDVQILRKQFDKAIESFDQAIALTKSDEDKAYALFRQGYAMVQASRPAEAAAKYEQLSEQFPESRFALTALMASAQSIYRSGDLEQAAERFQRVLNGKDQAAATEAAHWLARIEISKSRLDQAERIVREQIKQGTEGPFAAELQLDLAEILSTQPASAAEAMKLFEGVYRDNPKSAVASRALYNAAFSALQVGELPKSFELAKEFFQQYPNDALHPDVQFIAAESLLLQRDVKQAAERYLTLVQSTEKDNVQRPIWTLRTAVALNASQQFDETVRFLESEFNSLSTDDQKAEAYQLIGRAQMLSGNGAAAVKSMQSGIKASPTWLGNTQSRLLMGQAYAESGNNQQAIETWNGLIDSAPTSLAADQARYKIAQVASSAGDYDLAIERYQQILDQGTAQRILPHAEYGKAWALMQDERYKPAVDSLNRIIDQYPEHPLQDDAILARGICRRNLGQFEQAKADLEGFLARSPTGTNLGHALYELALIDQKNQAPQQAAEKLNRLVAEVTDYPAMDKVLYELGWSLQETGDAANAADYFEKLVTSFPDADLTADAAYYLGQNHYAADQWEQAANRFALAADSKDESLSEKALYRLGWSRFKLADYPAAETAFAEQYKRHPEGQLSFDALAMVGECQFKQENFQAALVAYGKARERIEQNDDKSSTVREKAARQVRELTLLHGAQCAAQLEQWETAIDWHQQHRQRFPSSSYLPQVFYETGFAHHQKGDTKKALKFYTQVADKYRSEVGARARFMIGEIHFADQAFQKAIPEFQRVMFGYGAEQAPADIKNWQAKSGFEAGRCSEVLMQSAKTKASKQKAAQFSKNFYTYVIEKHADHQLASDARKRLEALEK